MLSTRDLLLRSVYTLGTVAELANREQVSGGGPDLVTGVDSLWAVRQAVALAGCVQAPGNSVFAHTRANRRLDADKAADDQSATMENT